MLPTVPALGSRLGMVVVIVIVVFEVRLVVASSSPKLEVWYVEGSDGLYTKGGDSVVKSEDELVVRGQDDSVIRDEDGLTNRVEDELITRGKDGLTTGGEDGLATRGELGGKLTKLAVVGIVEDSFRVGVIGEICNVVLAPVQKEAVSLLLGSLAMLR